MRDMPAELPAGTAERCRAVAGRADQDVTDVESGSRCPEAARWRYRCVSRSCFVRSGVVRPGKGRHREMAGAAHPESPGPPAGQPSTPFAHPGRLHLQNRRRTGGVDGRKIGSRNELVKEKSTFICNISQFWRRADAAILPPLQRGKWPSAARSMGVWRRAGGRRPVATRWAAPRVLRRANPTPIHTRISPSKEGEESGHGFPSSS